MRRHPATAATAPAAGDDAPATAASAATGDAAASAATASDVLADRAELPPARGVTL